MTTVSYKSSDAAVAYRIFQLKQTRFHSKRSRLASGDRMVSGLIGPGEEGGGEAGRGVQSKHEKQF